MALRRELMSYLGTGAIGGMIGYYAGAQGLLGIQSQEVVRDSPENEDPPESPDSESTGRILYDWESGQKGNWEKTGIAYGYTGHVYEFRIIEQEAISGSYSPQNEALNDDVYVQSPSFTSEFDGSANKVSGKFRLEGDLDASAVNTNQFKVNDSSGSSNGSVRFHHGDLSITWSGKSTENLQSFELGQVYDIHIIRNDGTFTVMIDGTEYTGLEPRDGQETSIHSVNVDSYNGGGGGPSVYDDSVYFTWDEIVVE